MGIAAARNAIFSLRASKPRFRADAESKEASGPVSRRPEAPADVLNLSSERGEERAVGRKAASSLPLAFVGAGNKARIEKGVEASKCITTWKTLALSRVLS